MSIPCLKPLRGSHHPRRKLTPIGIASVLPETGPQFFLFSLQLLSHYFLLFRYQPPGLHVCCYLCQGHVFLKKLSWEKQKMKIQLLQILAETRCVFWNEGFVLISRNCTNSLEQENLHLTIEPFGKLWHVELI